MEEPVGSSAGTRRNEDIALDMMKFIAVTTGYGRTSSPGAGFQSGNDSKAEDYARHLLDLYGQCLGAVQGKSNTKFAFGLEPGLGSPAFLVTRRGDRYHRPFGT